MILSELQIDNFKSIVAAVLNVDDRNSQSNNFNDAVKVLNQLYNSVKTEDFERFVDIICQANVSEFRSPK